MQMLVIAFNFSSAPFRRLLSFYIFTLSPDIELFIITLVTLVFGKLIIFEINDNKYTFILYVILQ